MATEIEIHGSDSQAAASGPKPDRQKELLTSLTDAISDLRKLCIANSIQIASLICLNTFLLIVGYCIGKDLYNYTGYGEFWTWQLIYVTTTRIVLVSLFASLVVFTLNLLKSYLDTHRINRDKLFIVRSMASLVTAGADYTKQEHIFNKLLDILVSESNHINSKDVPKVITSQILEELVETLKKVIKKENSH
jgi:hypothetical protein